jgi:hypothetical protein
MMVLEFKGHGTIVVRRMEIRDVEQVIALVAQRIEEDQVSGRSRRLGPISRETLVLSFEEFSGLSVVLEDAARKAIVGCALVTLFEPLEADPTIPDLSVAEAAKLTLDHPLFGTRAAPVLHALRIVGVALLPRLGGNPIKLYYNVLSGNERQLDHLADFKLERTEPDGYVGAVLAQRASRIDLEGQKILSFALTETSLRHSVELLLNVLADRVFSRSDRRTDTPTVEAWPLEFAHPLLTDELPILITLADELQVAVPKELLRRKRPAGG